MLDRGDLLIAGRGVGNGFGELRFASTVLGLERFEVGLCRHGTRLADVCTRQTSTQEWTGT